MNFASLDTQVDPQVARLVEIYLVLHFVLKFNNRSATYNFLLNLQSNVEDICSWSDDNKLGINTNYWSK